MYFFLVQLKWVSYPGGRMRILIWSFKELILWIINWCIERKLLQSCSEELIQFWFMTISHILIFIWFTGRVFLLSWILHVEFICTNFLYFINFMQFLRFLNEETSFLTTFKSKAYFVFGPQLILTFSCRYLRGGKHIIILN